MFHVCILTGLCVFRVCMSHADRKWYRRCSCVRSTHTHIDTQRRICMQKPCEHLARTSSRRRGSCVFSFRLGTRNLRLPTAASNHRRCTHTNTVAQTHNLSHESLTLQFFFTFYSLNTRKENNKPTAESTAAVVIAAAVTHSRENL